MSESMQHLRSEHQRARAFLMALENHVRDLRQETHGDSREASALFEYLAEIFFVKHEEKEETILLPELIRLRTKFEPEVLRIIREQHQRGHTLLDELWKALRPGESWDPAQREGFLRYASSWIRFVRGHLRYEEEFLFPHFEAALDSASEPDLDAQILREFKKIDAEFELVPDAGALKEAATHFVALHQAAGQR